MKINGILGLIIISLLSGCATTVSECDPAIKQNTATTVGCIFSGNYKARQISLEAALEEEKAITESLQQIYALLDAERTGISRNLASTRDQYKKLNTTLNNLISQISKNSQGNIAIQQQIDDLKNKMTVLNNTTSSSQKKLALSALYTEVDNLKKELGYN
jgi:septal ring factor EnvC (AmiA/AmiB activator)